jgi:outer membrane protein, heavy metal efflux system
MRVVCLTVLLVGIGCRTVPDAAVGSRDRAGAESAALLSSPARLPSTDSNIVPTAFSSESENGIKIAIGDPSSPDQWRSTSHDSDATQIESVSLTVPQSLTLTLEAAIQTALVRNPDLMVVRSAEPVAHAAWHVAKTYPFNPQFQTQVLPYTRDNDGNDAPVSQQHVLVETFELAGQTRLRASVAGATWEQVRRTIRQAELVTVAQAERMYFAALYQRELRKASQLLVTLNDAMVGVTERRLKAGQANSADVALARLQAQSSRRQQRLMDANYQTALRQLLNFLNVGEDGALQLTDRWLDWEWNSMADVLGGYSYQLQHEGQAPGLSIEDSVTQFEPSIRGLIAERPDVAAARAGVAMARENLTLAEAMRTPNLQIGPMWQRDDSASQFWGVQAQVNVPIVNTGTPLVRQRYAELQQQRITATRLEEKAVLEAGAAIRRYERARRLVEQSRSDFALDMTDTLQPFEDQFRAGQIGLLQVFAGRTSLAQSRQSFLALLNELALAAADVTLTTGLPVRQLILDVPPTLNEGNTVPTP